MKEKLFFTHYFLLLLVLLLAGCGRGEGEIKKGTTEKREKSKKESFVKNQDIAAKIVAPSFDNSLPGEEGLKNAIRGYNTAVINAHLSDAHMRFLSKYAIESESQRVYIWINTDRERKIAMHMRVNKLVFDNVSSSKDSGAVETSEQWDYQFIDVETGKPTEPVKDARYKLRYSLIRQNDAWIVERIEELEKSKIGIYSPPRWSLN